MAPLVREREIGGLSALLKKAHSRRRGKPLIVKWGNPDGMSHIGVDPGTSGGLAVLSSRCDLIYTAPLPCIEITPRRGRARYSIDGAKLLGMLSPLFGEPAHAWIEDPGVVSVRRRDPNTGEIVPMRSMGSIASLHASLGAVETLLQSLNFTTSRVLPVHWKKPFGLYRSDDPKARARQIAAVLWKETFTDCRVRDTGQAEAALIAMYGARYIAPIKARTSKHEED